MRPAGRPGFDLNAAGDGGVRDRSKPESYYFYDDLPSFDDFEKVHDLSLYTPAPDDWTVVLADITGSTKAIREGHYKDVNLIGAACITAALNAAGDAGIAYVFGGDGASLLVPNDRISDVRAALLKTKNLARSGFHLDLRVGAIPLPLIRAAGVDVLVAKFRLSHGNYLAMFNGGGVALADRLIKADDGSKGFLFVEDGEGDEPDLDGLSCRWQPLKSQRGVMLSLLVQPLDKNRDRAAATTAAVLRELNAVLGYGMEQNRPVVAENMKFVWPPRGLIAEARATQGQGPGFKRRLAKILLQSFIQYLLEKFDRQAGGYDAPVYRQELRQNSDYRKFDDMLRFVLDCPRDDADKIEGVLRRLREDGLIAYGTHRADSALMTCLLFSLDDSEHVHFIDVSNGGFAMAAVGLKEQLRESAGLTPA